MNESLRQLVRRVGSPRSMKGQALVEFALIVPLLLLLILIIIDFGRAFYIQTALQNGAREGARFGTIHPTWVTSTNNADPNNISYRAKNEPGGTAGTVTVAITCTTTGGVTYTSAQAGYQGCAVSGSRVDVTVTAQFQALTPLIGGFLPSGGLALSGHTKMAIE
jgi:Flp pilus assembly protein TadG